MRPGHPRSGRVHEFGPMTIGERSYVAGEWAEKMRVRDVDGGKCTPWWDGLGVGREEELS